MEGGPSYFITLYNNIDVGTWDVYSGYPGPRWNVAKSIYEVAMFFSFCL